MSFVQDQLSHGPEEGGPGPVWQHDQTLEVVAVDVGAPLGAAAAAPGPVERLARVLAPLAPLHCRQPARVPSTLDCVLGVPEVVPLALDFLQKFKYIIMQK